MKVKRKGARKGHAKAKGNGREPKVCNAAAAKDNTQPSENEVALETKARFKSVMKRAVTLVCNLSKQAAYNAVFFEEGAKLTSNEGEKSALLEMADYCDDALGIMARSVGSHVGIRAETTQNSELLGHLYCATLDNLERFPQVWRRFIDYKSEDLDTSSSPGFWLLESLTVAVRFFQDECERYPEAFRVWAKENPYLPMMVFQNKSAYRFRFEKLAAAVKLGERCPINVSPRAQFRFDLPLNTLVFEAFMDFLWAQDWIRHVRKEDPEKAWRKGATMEDRLAEQAGMARKLQRIYFAAADLPPLTKTSAADWATKAVIPYLEVEHPDWSQLPALARYMGKSGGRAKAKEAISEAVRALAKPAPPESCPAP